MVKHLIFLPPILVILIVKVKIIIRRPLRRRSGRERAGSFVNRPTPGDLIRRPPARANPYVTAGASHRRLPGPDHGPKRPRCIPRRAMAN